uniref:Microtubule-associated protein 9 n=1 Tax=Amphilophus citrinellus TaxID=61819 RepID=A0A3Q0RSJ4_AMPCI
KMTDQEYGTLAYTKSPKTTKRTTFQDELQAAVSARASKAKTDQYSYSDDFEEDEDGKTITLLKSRKKRADTLKAGKSKAKTSNSFELSDDEGKHSRTKKVSFLKTQRIGSPANSSTASESQEKNELPDYPNPERANSNGSVSSQYPTNVSKDEAQSVQFNTQYYYKIPVQILHLDLHLLFSDSVPEREPPRPKPRQRTLGLSIHATEKPAEEFQDLSRPQTSSTSIPLSTDTSGTIAVRSCSPAVTSSSHTKTTSRSQSACSRKVESKYLGSLKVLDRKVSLQESQPQEADSLRAAIYQEWLKKKKEKSREIMQLKKKEDMLKEKKKKQEEEAKKEDAVASYEAWKDKKAESLKAKAKEREALIRKEQKAAEEKEEKQQTAKQVFEKWKCEHDHLLKEKYRKQREAENKLKLTKQEQEDERKKDSRSAFSNWCEKKKDVLHEKLTSERRELKNKAEEEKYIKEERDKMALETYENWVARKDLEQKRRKEERRIQAILGDSPPPPWSPPNKTIPFRR